MLTAYYCVAVARPTSPRRLPTVLGAALVAVFLPVVVHGRASVRARAAGRPNILFILMDDMRSDGVMNNPAVLP